RLRSGRHGPRPAERHRVRAGRAHVRVRRPERQRLLDGAHHHGGADELRTRGAHALAGAAVLLAVVAAGCLEEKAKPAPGALGRDGNYFEPVPDPDPVGDAGFMPDGGAGDWVGTWKFVSGSQGNLCGGSLAVVETTGFLDISVSDSGKLLTVVED